MNNNHEENNSANANNEEIWSFSADNMSAEHVSSGLKIKCIELGKERIRLEYSGLITWKRNKYVETKSPLAVEKELNALSQSFISAYRIRKALELEKQRG